MATNKPVNVSPRSRAAFIQLMQQYPNLVITWQMARNLEACQEGLLEFRARYFPRRRQLKLEELIPFIRFNTPYWDDVGKVINGVLEGQGILSPGYTISGRVHCPVTKLPGRYLAEAGRYAEPKSFEGFLRLMKKHGNCTIHGREFDGAFLTGFCRKRFPGRKRIRIEELILFVEHQHGRWSEVVEVTRTTLEKRKLLIPGYNPSAYFTYHMGPEGYLREERLAA